MTLVAMLLFCVAMWLGTAVLAVAMARLPAARKVIYGAALATSLIALGTAITAAAQAMQAANAEIVVLNAAVSTATLPLGLPWLGAHFRLDALAAFFLAVVNLAAAAASLYGLGYGRHEEAPHRVLPFYPAFLAGMNLVILADDAFTFLLCWEFMSLASWALVLAQHRENENRRAGYVYLTMASFGTLALLLAFGLLSGPAGDYGFAAIRAASHEALPAALVLILVLIGAGSKAGLVPLHVWLPLAHPAAPSHVSALMSGAMTKVAIYGFIRIIFDLLGEPPWWSSIAVLVIGGATAVLGVLQALMQRDLKRLLAYSTIENVGVIFCGLGLALAFQASGMASAAALALTAALFHVFNHALFKSLLFFGAGAVLTATHERDLERLGGLIHRMPSTALFVLVGCAAISALPPLNGFVSEWLTFQAILQSPALPQWGLKIIVPAIGALLALAAALAAACFVKAFGIVFLGRPRTNSAIAAQEVDRSSRAAMGILAGLCLLAGLLPGPIIDWMSPVTLSLLGDRMPGQAIDPWLSLIPIAQGRSSYNGLLVFLFIAFSASIATLAIHRFASNRTRRAPAWDCGFVEPSPATQYTGDSFSQPIRRVFGSLVFRARERVEMPQPGDLGAARHQVELRDLIWDGLYASIAGAIGFAADRLNHLQFLTIRRYLSMVFLALVILLLVLAI
jgi:formate hydrogenlyase subunit 3/multisubunit Na+/H+ antiporter MnhD subunit